MRIRTTFPWLTIVLVVSNLAIWAILSGPSQERADALIDTLAFTPAHMSDYIAHGNTVSAVKEGLRSFTSIFVHENDPWHVGLNMLFLVLCGLALEKRLGSACFGVLYVAAGVLTCAVYFALCPDGRASYGASSAVCGVLGAYLVVFLKEHPFWSIIPGALLVLNFVGATNAAAVAQTGFTFWAHLSGYAIGALLAAVMQLQIASNTKAARTLGFHHKPQAS